MTARYIIGDTREVLKTLPDASVDLVLSSPPFLALRSYLPADHPDKPFEIGSEATPGAFLDVLLDVVEECARVLSPWGTLAFELGDTYGGSKQETREDVADASRRWGGKDGAPTLTGFRGGTVDRMGDGWPLDKSLCLIPSSFAWALAYGRNPWTGRETEKWRVRNLVAWCRPNPPVGALGDKFRPATSYLTVAAKRRDRWFDLDAVRDFNNPDRMNEPSGGRPHMPKGIGNRSGGSAGGEWNPAGAPPLDWWEIPTQPYAGSHYATWPEKLCVRPIEAMCPREVCRVCGEPRRRIVETERPVEPDERRVKLAQGEREPVKGHGAPEIGWEIERTTVGWTDCGHDQYRRGVVLDPFAGSGTTLAVAEGYGRDSIGIDLDSRNADLARERVGIWLSVEDYDREGVA